MSTCAFCRSRNLPFTHSVTICTVLAKHLCTYCKELGHTNSRCPKGQLASNFKKRMDDSYPGPTHVTVNTNSWASIVAKNIPLDIAATIAKEDLEQEIKIKKQEKEKKERERIRKEEKRVHWEKNYIQRMEKRFGTFWMFHVERFLNLDQPCAKKLRETPNQVLSFRQHLYETYGVNWLSLCEDTDDDCYYLVCLRDKEYADECREQRETLAQVSKTWKARDKEEDDMRSKLANGVITEYEFKDWYLTRELEDLNEEGL